MPVTRSVKIKVLDLIILVILDEMWAMQIRRIFRKWDVGEWTGSSWFRIRRVGGHL
jgi:hypothetical protein